jgi:hypothetical protein
MKQPLPVGRIFMKFCIWDFCQNFIDTLQQNWTKITDFYVKTYLFYVYGLAW